MSRNITIGAEKQTEPECGSLKCSKYLEFEVIQTPTKTTEEILSKLDVDLQLNEYYKFAENYGDLTFKEHVRILKNNIRKAIENGYKIIISWE